MRGSSPQAKRRGLLGGAAALALLGSALVGCTRAASETRPNILVFVTDDQRWDTLWAMPNVRRHLSDRGVTFTNAFVTTPLCCPSRASIFTGKYAHATGLWHNKGRYGGFRRFQDRSTLATWLKGAGYTTGLFGKYLNRYRGKYVPPGWDRWVAFADIEDPYDLYYRYLMNIDGQVELLGTKHGPQAYSTNLVATEAVRFILRTESPFFAYFAPYAPHSPSKPAPGDKQAFTRLRPQVPPSYNEADVSDKPAWVRQLPSLSSEEDDGVSARRRDSYRSLLAVDRAVGAMIEALRLTDRLQDTLILFTSDNGMSWGEHRWVNKVAPYEESIRVPFVLRYDRLVRTARRDSHLVLNLDIAPTLTEAAGVRAPGALGRSLFPLVRSDAVQWRSDFAIEYAFFHELPIPSYCGIRSNRFAYIRYSTGEEELYEVATDPYQLRNVAEAERMASPLRSLRTRAGELCRPRPPGWRTP